MPGGKIVCERKEQEQENELADKQKKKKKRARKMWRPKKGLPILQ